MGQKKPCRNALSARALDPMGSHICLCVSLPTAPVRPPGECTSISNRLVFFCTKCRQRIGTWQTDGLLSALLPAPQGASLFGEIERYVVPMPEPEARRQGLKAHLRPQGQLPLQSELEAPSGVAALRQAWGTWQRPCRQLLRAQRESTCQGLSSYACSILLMARQTLS